MFWLIIAKIILAIRAWGIIRYWHNPVAYGKESFQSQDYVAHGIAIVLILLTIVYLK
jgi:hypothetical protein